MNKSFMLILPDLRYNASRSLINTEKLTELLDSNMFTLMITYFGQNIDTTSRDLHKTYNFNMLFYP